jgi:hypothetical protein
MARFLDKLASGRHPPQLLVDHPNAGNGERAIRAEMHGCRRSPSATNRRLPAYETQACQRFSPFLRTALPNCVTNSWRSYGWQNRTTALWTASTLDDPKVKAAP